MQPVGEEASSAAPPSLPKRLAVLAALAASGRVAVTKPARFREICEVDVSRLVGLVQKLSDVEWDAENATKENDFAVFSQTRHIIARFSPAAGGPEDYYSTDFWARWSDTLTPALSSVAARYDLRRPDFSKVMLARLAAGGRIDPHYDIGVSNHLTHKIHVPLITNPKVWFRVEGETFRLEVGKAYELNNVGLHAVSNEGPADRIHLIFELFDRANFTAARSKPFSAEDAPSGRPVSGSPAMEVPDRRRRGRETYSGRDR